MSYSAYSVKEPVLYMLPVNYTDKLNYSHIIIERIVMKYEKITYNNY